MEAASGSNAEFYDFFASAYADLYSVLDAGEAVRQWLMLLRDVSIGFTPTRRRHPRLLDVGCGLGWHLASWAAVGYSAAGLDSSPRMLTLARQALKVAGADGVPLYEVNLLESEMIRQVGEPYDLLVSHTNFPQIFSPQQLRRVAESLVSVSKPGSLWMMDLTCPALAPGRAIDRFTDAAGNEWTARGIRSATGRRYHLTWRNEHAKKVERYWMHDIGEIDKLLGSSGWFRTALRSWHPQDRDAPWRQARATSKRLVVLYECGRERDDRRSPMGDHAL